MSPAKKNIFLRINFGLFILFLLLIFAFGCTRYQFEDEILVKSKKVNVDADFDTVDLINFEISGHNLKTESRSYFYERTVADYCAGIQTASLGQNCTEGSNMAWLDFNCQTKNGKNKYAVTYVFAMKDKNGHAIPAKCGTIQNPGPGGTQFTQIVSADQSTTPAAGSSTLVANNKVFYIDDNNLRPFDGASLTPFLNNGFGVKRTYDSNGLLQKIEMGHRNFSKDEFNGHPVSDSSIYGAVTIQNIDSANRKVLGSVKQYENNKHVIRTLEYQNVVYDDNAKHQLDQSACGCPILGTVFSSYSASSIVGAPAPTTLGKKLLLTTRKIDFGKSTLGCGFGEVTDIVSGISNVKPNVDLQGSGFCNGSWYRKFSTGESADDSTPQTFSFTSVTNAALSTDYYSNQITITGINVNSPLTISGGYYSYQRGTAAFTVYSSQPTMVQNGDVIRVKGTSAATNATTLNATLTIGGVSATYSITTMASSPPPNLTHGECGDAADTAAWPTDPPPSWGLCDVGGLNQYPSGNGPWNWTCTGTDGVAVNCRKYTLVNLSCSDANAHVQSGFKYCTDKNGTYIDCTACNPGVCAVGYGKDYFSQCVALNYGSCELQSLSGDYVWATLEGSDSNNSCQAKIFNANLSIGQTVSYTCDPAYEDGRIVIKCDSETQNSSTDNGGQPYEIKLLKYDKASGGFFDWQLFHGLGYDTSYGTIWINGDNSAANGSFLKIH